MLDKNFSVRVTSRTFDVASYLRSREWVIVSSSGISAINFDEYREANELILNGQMVFPIIVTGAPDVPYGDGLPLVNSR